jgi:hypothetical protein
MQRYKGSSGSVRIAPNARSIRPWLTLAKISAAQAPEGPPPMTATRIGLSSAMLTLATGLRLCCRPARPPATKLKDDEGRRDSIVAVQLALDAGVAWRGARSSELSNHEGRRRRFSTHRRPPPCPLLEDLDWLPGDFPLFIRVLLVERGGSGRAAEGAWPVPNAVETKQ